MNRLLSMQFFLVAGLVTAAMMGSSGCALEKASTATDGTGTSGSDTGNQVDESKFQVVIKTPTDTTQALTTFYSTETEAAAERQTAVECNGELGLSKYCIFEMDELDIWQRGYTLSFNYPSSMCKYEYFMPYYYQVGYFEPAPLTLSYTTDSDGNVITNTCLMDGAPCFSASPTDGTETLFTDAFDATMDEEDVKCPYDYSTPSFAGSNCCYGKYSKTVTDDEGEITTTEENWGGSYGNCVRGPAMNDSYGNIFATGSSQFSPNGLPVSFLGRVAEGGNKFELEVEPVQTIHSGALQSELVYSTNYFNPAEHGNNYPFPLRNYAFPFYRLDCLDENYEILARVDVMVRKWNRQGDIEDEGDPDIAGCEDAPFASYPISDFCDWNELSTDAASKCDADDDSDVDVDNTGSGEDLQNAWCRGQASWSTSSAGTTDDQLFAIWPVEAH